MPQPPATPKPALKACPVCGKPAAEPRFRPFCSARCAEVDLHRWLGGVYRVETDETPEEGQGGQ